MKVYAPGTGNTYLTLLLVAGRQNLGKKAHESQKYSFLFILLSNITINNWFLLTINKS